MCLVLSYGSFLFLEGHGRYLNIFAEKGKVIGVTFAGVEDGQNINFALPSNEVLNLYKYKSNPN